MRTLGLRPLATGLSLASSLLASCSGCSGFSGVTPERDYPVPAPQKAASSLPTARSSNSYDAPSPIRLVSGTTQPDLPTPRPLPPPFEGTSELSVEVLTEQVLARNPTLAQMVAAWQAAAARYPQVTSLDDPTFGVKTTPGVWGSNQLHGGYSLDFAQKYPWPGKLALRGDNAQAAANAAGRDVDDTRLQLVETARNAFYEYYLVGRALTVNEEALRLLNSFKQDATAQYKAGKAPQTDINRADVEIGRERERQVTLERMREVAIARINTLMHLPTNSSLPPPPKELQLVSGLPEVEALQAAAIARRPDLQALTDRIAAEQAAVALALKEYYPDVQVMAGYNTLWQERPLQAYVGLQTNLPVRLTRRSGAVAEAQARVAQRRAELARLTDQANFQVLDAYAKVRESERVVRLFEKEILPAADRNVKSARTAYTAGQIPFLTLIDALRNQVDLQDRYYEALSDYFRRRAALERAVGSPVPLALPVPNPSGPGGDEKK